VVTATANQQAIRAPIVWPVPLIVPTCCVDDPIQVSGEIQLGSGARWEVLEVQDGIDKAGRVVVGG
jgi:hypothetical protein